MASTIRHPHRINHWGTWLARGSGRPDREPSERRQTGGPDRARTNAGGGSPTAAGLPTEDRLDRRDGPPPTRVSLPCDVGELPALPATFGTTLDAGLAAAGLALTATAREAIETHVRLLLAWNAAINLTAITDPAAIATRHVLDSLSALPLLEDRTAAGTGLRLVDLGSGGGFPGLPIAAALPSADATLVEATAKKVRFLEAAIHATGLGPRAEARWTRAEALAGVEAWDVVTARAVGRLALLVELALPLLRPGGRLIAWKRGDLTAELAAVRSIVARLGGGTPRLHPVGLPGLEGHVLVEVARVATGDC